MIAQGNLVKLIAFPRLRWPALPVLDWRRALRAGRVAACAEFRRQVRSCP